MGTTIKISDELYKEAKKHAKVYHRSIPGQVEYWAKLGRTAMDNPDLPVEFIHQIFMAMEEVEAGEVSEYKFGDYADDDGGAH